MTLIDFIGFMISFFALIFLFFKNRYEKSAPLEETRMGDDELPDDHPLHDYLRSLEDQISNSQPKKPETKREIIQSGEPASGGIRKKKLRSQLADHKLKSSLENYKLKSSLEDHKLETELTTRFSKQKMGESYSHPTPRIVGIMNQLKNDRINLLVYHEILGKPKGL